MVEAQILVASQGGVVQVRVVGRATFKISHALRAFAQQAFGQDTSSIIVDLSACQGMDSTFMGVLAMIGLEGRGRCQLLIVNASAAHVELLDSIGVSRLWQFVGEPVADVTWTTLCEAASGATDVGEAAPTILEAHRALMELTPENIPKFKNVVDLLAAEMPGDRAKGDSDD